MVQPCHDFNELLQQLAEAEKKADMPVVEEIHHKLNVHGLISWLVSAVAEQTAYKLMEVIT